MRVRSIDIKVIGTANIIAGSLIVWWAIDRFFDVLATFNRGREIYGLQDFAGGQMFIPIAVAGFICVICGLLTLKKKRWNWGALGPACVLLAGIYAANIPYPYLM